VHIVARNCNTGSWIELTLQDGLIAKVRALSSSEARDRTELWVAPAFWDIQVNGREGLSFSGPDLTVAQVRSIALAQGPLGTARFCPTLITAPAEQMLHGLRTIAAACECAPEVDRAVLGIHLEGPFLSEQEGYRGAHPAAEMRDPSWALFEEFQRAAGGRIVLVTLAPERKGAIEFIRRASGAGIVVALGHTAASGALIREAAAAGARLSTHLGNGIASMLPRHPNPIWEQAALETLSASLIADGDHLDLATLRVLLKAKGPERSILVSDASPLAGLAPGRYGDWEIEPSGRIVVADTPYLAGANHGLETGMRVLLEATGWGLGDCIDTVTANPARLLGRSVPTCCAKEPANLVLFRFSRPSEFMLVNVWIDGREVLQFARRA
jgi:N-acetylglucosamine-6-phosphate deacetylase